MMQRHIEAEATPKPKLNVVASPTPTVEAVLTQINTMDQDQLGEVVRAIAHRIYPPNSDAHHQTH